MFTNNLNYITPSTYWSIAIFFFYLIEEKQFILKIELFTTHCSWCHGNYLTTICEQWPHVPLSCLEMWWCLLLTMKTNTMQSYRPHISLWCHCHSSWKLLPLPKSCCCHSMLFATEVVHSSLILPWIITFINKLGNSITFTRRVVDYSGFLFLFISVGVL